MINQDIVHHEIKDAALPLALKGMVVFLNGAQAKRYWPQLNE
jgi:hypothetical protein